MKTKLVVIGLAMALGAWLATANSPTVRTLEQRVAELEQMVGQLNQVVASQQQEIDRFAPVANEMELVIWPDGRKTIHFANADLWADGDFCQFKNLLIMNDIYYYGSLVDIWQ